MGQPGGRSYEPGHSAGQRVERSRSQVLPKVVDRYTNLNAFFLAIEFRLFHVLSSVAAASASPSLPLAY